MDAYYAQHASRAVDDSSRVCFLPVFWLLPLDAIGFVAINLVKKTHGNELACAALALLRPVVVNGVGSLQGV
jgi:hypothetical protein